MNLFVYNFVVKNRTSEKLLTCQIDEIKTLTDLYN